MAPFQSRIGGRLIALAASMLATFAAGAAGPDAPREVTGAIALDQYTLAMGEDGRVNVFVQFRPESSAVVYEEELQARGGAESPQAVQAATQAARAQAAQNRAIQNDFVDTLETRSVGHDVLYRAVKVVNGVALRVEPAAMEILRSLPNVARVEILPLEELNNSTSVPFLGTPSVWDNTAGLPQGSTGQGISIGVIDTGIDYLHGQFGGAGANADYLANDRTVIGDGYFPTAKVVGGFDFAGDAYNGSNAPTPDPDPMDCNGHGSHVSGTAAGFGVNTDGTSYAGPWNSTVNYQSLRIGPGTAPQASLYALRVFGCSGSTGLTVAAIEWAADPNGDDDFSDHLDVINMSLGSNFGDKFNPSALASDAAAAIGVIVVASAGNAGDSFFISGSPGSSSRTLAVASSLDSGQAATALRVNAPAPIAGFKTAGTASFGTVPPPGGLTRDVVRVDDGSTETIPPGGMGGTINDGCQTPFVNAADVAGNIVLIDRGSCGFKQKAVNAQLNGAVGVIIANVASSANPTVAPGMADDPALPAVTIPVNSLNLADGDSLRTNEPAPGVNATLFPGSDNASSFTSRGPRRASPRATLKPDIAAPGSNITSAQTGIVSAAGAPVPGSQPLTISGTSMAAPHMAGIMALLRDLHPNRSVEELKAQAMNYARHDVTTLPEGAGLRFAPSRLGTGRVDVPLGAGGNVVAFNADETGVVSIAFDSDVRGVVTRTKELRLVNHSNQAQSFDVALDLVVDGAGVSFSLPDGPSVSVPANGSTTITVRMDADAAQMDHTRDATLAATQAVGAPINISLSRHFMAEEAGHIKFSQAGQERMRVAVHTAAVPESAMSASDVITTLGAPTGSTSITLSGTEVCTGTSAPASCTLAGTDQQSVVTPFELQVVSPRNPVIAPQHDIQYAGVAYRSASDLMLFGFSTFGYWSSPADTSFSIDIDCGVYTLVSSLTTDTCTGAPDGVFDLRLFSTSTGGLNNLFTSTSQNDVLVSAVIGLQPGRTGSVQGPLGFSNGFSAAAGPSRVHQNQVLFVAAPRANLKISGEFRYRVSTCAGFSPICSVAARQDFIAGPFTWNYLAGTQGLDFGGGMLLPDLNGATIPVTFNTPAFTAFGSQGALLLHHYNGEGSRAEVAVLEGTPTADLSIAMSVDDPSVQVGGLAVFTITVTNNSAAVANGVQAVHDLPPGMTYVGDNSGGTFNGTTGLWTIGTLAAGASVSIEVIARVDASGEQNNVAQITASTPLDPVADNNEARVSINGATSADLVVGLSADVTDVLAGAPVTFTITLDNDGADQAFSINVTELFIAGGVEPIQPTGFVASEGSYDPATGVWTLASRSATAPGPATLALTFTAPTVNNLATLTLRAVATSETADPSTANNTATASITVRTDAMFSDGFE